MSRCFQYPPPGYMLSDEKKGALIELIKLQKEKEMKKQKRDKKKRKREEKKLKREEKKKKREEKKKSSKEKKDNVSQKVDNSDLVNERMDAETEQSQQSGLTEEHGHPEGVPVPSSSYDSTENSSNKRKRQSPPVECSHGHDKANLIRQAPKGQSVSRTLAKGRRHTDDCCYTSGRTSSREQICSTSGKTGFRSSLNAVMHVVELQYKQLFESWFPPQLHDVSLYPDNLDWLYPDRSKQDTQRAEKRQRSGGDSISCSRSSTTWHRAEYLPEIDAFALPYVVPY